jgi:AcrR family transcriptional regulator
VRYLEDAPSGDLESDPRLSDSGVSSAGLSHKDLHAVFASEEECIEATLEEGIARLARAVGEEVARVVHRDGWIEDELWLARVRAGLVGLLGFLDDEAVWGQLLFLRMSELGAVGLEYEQRVCAILHELLASERPLEDGTNSEATPTLVDELVTAGVLSMIRARLLNLDGERWVELAPSLTSFATVSYSSQARASVALAHVPGGSFDHKRASTREPRALGSATDTCSCGGRGSLRDALSQTSGVGGSPGGGLARRSIGNREDKGVVDK